MTTSIADQPDNVNLDINKGQGEAVAPGGKAGAQRERILQAARSSFIEHGFHAANMAGIARLAGISQGLIYRYFQGKREIVLEIIADQLARNREGLEQMRLGSDLLDELTEAFVLWCTADARIWNVALFAEITAEATRDPVIARALQESEKIERDIFATWLRKRDQAAGRRATPAQRERRGLLMQCLCEGLAIRAARQPDLNPRRVRDMLAMSMPLVLGD